MSSSALEGCVENTVCAVKAVLDETKNERRKRGKYHKYSTELQQEMAVYASEHGSPRAAEYFSKLLGAQVSESTIRNILKSHSLFSSSMKEEIAKYAINHGVDRAAAHFSEKFNRNISEHIVRKFKVLYKKKSSNDKRKSGTPSNENAIKRTLCTIKNEIEPASPSQNQPLVDISQTFTSQPINCQTTACFAQPTSIATLTQSTNGYSFQNMQVVTSTFTPHPSQQLTRDDNDGLIAQHFLLVTPDGGQGSFEMNIQSEKPDDKGGQICLSEYQSFHVDPQIFIDACPESLSPKVESIPLVPEITILSQPPTPAPSQPVATVEKPPKPKKENAGKKRRGKYCTFSPELRAEIGKYAAEHGCIKASNHFSEILGYVVAESTARALKQKYLQKVKHSDVTSLGFSQRGRPLRLGKYDEVVQECLKELFRSGEKVTSFLAITTAKEVLNKFEPELLEENGGTVVLNTSWAKSFLKRIGVRNNS